eukprot:811266-Pleurochrysis_carterae.AAC.7
METSLLEIEGQEQNSRRQEICRQYFSIYSLQYQSLPNAKLFGLVKEHNVNIYALRSGTGYMNNP